MQNEVRIQQQDFSGESENAALRRIAMDLGSIVNFTGYVRGTDNGQNILELELEHYPGMTEKSIVGIVEKAAARWPILASTVIHRVGRLQPGDQIVYVGVASRHRSDGFAACEFIMDYLKTGAPLWKKETINGGERWLDAASKDSELAGRWENDEA